MTGVRVTRREEATTSPVTGSEHVGVDCQSFGGDARLNVADGLSPYRLILKKTDFSRLHIVHSPDQIDSSRIYICSNSRVPTNLAPGAGRGRARASCSCLILRFGCAVPDTAAAEMNPAASRE